MKVFNTRKRRNLKDRLLARASLSFIGAMAGTTFTGGAVTVASAQEASEGSRDVIVVTARNREESIQDVPLAITAFDEESFKRRNIENLDDVARLTPGLSFEDFSGPFSSPVIRGQAQTRLTGLEQNVSSFLDGVYLPRNWAIDLGTSNLQRIEVVKGPQSARYGRNAFSGAINYVPFKATISDQAISGQITGTVGSDERYDGGARLNISLSDKFALAGTYNYSTFDGTFENDHPFADADVDPGTTGNVGGWENESYSFSGVFEPIDRLSIEASYFRFDVDAEVRAGETFRETAGQFNCGTQSGFAANFRLFCGELPQATETSINDPRSIGGISETDIIRTALNYDLTDTVSFSYTFGLVDGFIGAVGNTESDRVNCGLFAIFVPDSCAFSNTPNGEIRYLTHEARFVFDASESLRLELGGFISNGEDRDVFTTTFAPDFSMLTIDTVEPIADVIGDPSGTVTDTDLNSIFGAAQWTSEDGRLRLGAEVRYASNDISSFVLDTTGTLTGSVFEETFNFITPRITVDYDLNDSTLFYASVARGAKPGGFNPAADPSIPENLTFDPELNWTYEIGAKNSFLDDKVLFNLAVYYTDWNGLQINAPDTGSASAFPANIIGNFGNARVFGLEVDGSWLATDNLTFDGSISYANSQYGDDVQDFRFGRSFQGFSFIPAPCDDVVCASDGDISGNNVERTPPVQAAFGAQWDGKIPGSDLEYFVRGDASWQSEFDVSSVNIATVPDRFLLGLSGGVTYKNFDLRLWARNVTNETFVSNAFVVIIPFGNSINSFFGDRRSFGATGTISF